MPQLLIGLPFSVDAHAINDFEALTAGDVTNLNFGVDIAGDMSWLDSVLLPRL